MILENLIEFADSSTGGGYDAGILRQIKMIGVCASLMMWKLEDATNVEWPADITCNDVSEVAT